jgi:hypothetical protein
MCVIICYCGYKNVLAVLVGSIDFVDTSVYVFRVIIMK